MKHKTLATVAILGLFLTLAIASVQAQSANRIQVTIPFNFAAGDAKLKAGKYIVERLSMEQLTFASVDGKTRAFVLAPLALQRTRKSVSERLVFQRYGDQYFLSEIWISGGVDGNGLYPLRAERNVAKELAKTSTKSQSVEIIARSK
jgi:hypothetical protein